MDLVLRDGIEEIVAHRNRALELYREAFGAIREADAAVARARQAVADACGGKAPRAMVPRQAEEVSAFEDAVKLPDPDQYHRVARRLTDAVVWAALIERTDLDHLMDREAKEQLQNQMQYVPERVDPHSGQVVNQEEIDRGLPPVTVDAVLATLEGFAQEAGTIWRRGIANAFSSLDRRFRSHDGFKVGDRIILSNAFESSWGPTLHWSYRNYHRGHRDTLQDIERVFLVLDGKQPRAAYAGIVGQVEAARKDAEWPVTLEGDYFRLRAFKNGNAHLWMTRKDLVRRVNLELARYYGAAVGEGKDRDATMEEAEAGRAVGHARGLGYFETPDGAAERVVDELHMYRRSGGPPLRLLEPSAGTGALVRAVGAFERDHQVERPSAVDCVELDRERAAHLRALPGVRTVRHADFLGLGVDAFGHLFDRIVMNPPFDRGRDVDHVLHAWKFLEPGGRLVAVMSASTEFRQDRKARAFRALMEQHGAAWRDLPPGTFAPHTHVNALYVAVAKRS